MRISVPSNSVRNASNERALRACCVSRKGVSAQRATSSKAQDLCMTHRMKVWLHAFLTSVLEINDHLHDLSPLSRGKGSDFLSNRRMGRLKKILNLLCRIFCESGHDCLHYRAICHNFCGTECDHNRDHWIGHKVTETRRHSTNLF